MFQLAPLQRPLRTGLLLAGALVFFATELRAQEPVIVGGSGKPSVTVDLSVLEGLGAPTAIPGLLMPGRGPALNGGVTLRRPGTAPQTAPAPVAQPLAPPPVPKIALTPPEPKAAPVKAAEPMAAPKAPPVKAPPAVAMPEAMPEAKPESKIVLTPPAPAPVAETPKTPPAADIKMPDAPPPPVTLTEPKAPAPRTPPSVETPAKAVAAPKKQPAPEETARLTPTAPLAPGEPIHVAFGSESALLSDKAKAKLVEFSQRLKDNPGLRIQLLAYASGTQETASQARRLSLSRALVVRSFLIDQGLSSIRIDVRALGNKVKGEPADRVDLVFAEGE